MPARLAALRLAPDGRPRPEAPFGRGPCAARVLRAAMTVASAGAARLPAPLVERLAVAGGTVEWALRPRKRAVLAGHLGHALGASPSSGTVRRAVRAEVVNEARRSADLLHALARPEALLAGLRVEGDGPLRDLLAGGSGVVLAGAHVGGFEVVAPAAGALLPVPATAVVTDDWLAWAIADARASAGLRLAYAGRAPLDVVRRLRAGEAAIVFLDVLDDAPRTVPVRLLDAEVEWPAGPAALARLGRAPLVPFVALRDAPRRYRVVLGAPIPPPDAAEGAAGETRALQALADWWTPVLRTHADEWAAVYELRWRDPPEPPRRSDERA
jgi:lauroyl/myristoyl acyltransferase